MALGWAYTDSRDKDKAESRNIARDQGLGVGTRDGERRPAGVLGRPGAATDINIINKSQIILIGKLKPLPRAAH